MRWLPKLFRQVIKVGELTLEGPNGYREVFGGQADGPSVTILVTDPKVDRMVLANPELGVAEAYMDGILQVKSGNVDTFLRLIYLNIQNFWATPTFRALDGLTRLLHRLVFLNPIKRSRRNARHHYDTGNDFYRKWLDDDMQYSCAYFPDGDETLEEAQLAKKRHIAAKLGLKPGQRVLDIGCGWGGMALYLASVEEVEVLGVTLSPEQLKIARARADAMGLSNRVRFELRDYRELDETFDRIVSVGMLEHVGYNHLEEYFETVSDRLNEDGLALIHTISSRAEKSATGPFIRKYIFPGGYIPTVAEATHSIERSQLWLLDLEVWRIHYGRTLDHWLQRFLKVRDEVVNMYDERFARMWEFYLAGAKHAFFSGVVMVIQAQVGKTRDGVPLSRDYIGEVSRRYAALEPDFTSRISAATRQVFEAR